MTIVQTWPLEHWASHTGRVHVKQGPRATLLTEADITDMLKRVRRGATGIVKRNKVSFDEQQLETLRRTYFPTSEEDDAAYELESARRDQAIHEQCGPDRAEF